jgi:hypothetical protein
VQGVIKEILLSAEELDDAELARGLDAELLRVAEARRWAIRGRGHRETSRMDRRFDVSDLIKLQKSVPFEHVRLAYGRAVGVVLIGSWAPTATSALPELSSASANAPSIWRGHYRY